MLKYVINKWKAYLRKQQYIQSLKIYQSYVKKYRQNPKLSLNFQTIYQIQQDIKTEI
jgi:hypothetical protein